MTLIHIGANAPETAPCYALGDWANLLAAMERGDGEAVERIATNARPKLVPVANLKTVEPPSMADAAAAFWRKRGKAPKAYATDPSGIPVVLEVRT